MDHGHVSGWWADTKVSSLLPLVRIFSAPLQDKRMPAQ
jgi:hypothetical protein